MLGTRKLDYGDEEIRCKLTIIKLLNYCAIIYIYSIYIYIL